MLEAEAGSIGSAVENLDRLDLLLVVLDELFEGGEHRPCLLKSLVAEPCLEEFVGRLLIDDLIQ